MSVGKDEVTVVLPILNEEEAIGKVIEELRQAGYRNVPVVDGYSIDGTVKVAKLSDVCSGMYLTNTEVASRES